MDSDTYVVVPEPDGFSIQMIEEEPLELYLSQLGFAAAFLIEGAPVPDLSMYPENNLERYLNYGSVTSEVHPLKVLLSIYDPNWNYWCVVVGGNVSMFPVTSILSPGSNFVRVVYS